MPFNSIKASVCSTSQISNVEIHIPETGNLANQFQVRLMHAIAYLFRCLYICRVLMVFQPGTWTQPWFPEDKAQTHPYISHPSVVFSLQHTYILVLLHYLLPVLWWNIVLIFLRLIFTIIAFNQKRWNKASSCFFFYCISVQMNKPI